MSDLTNQNLSATEDSRGSFLNPRVWTEEGKINDIYLMNIAGKEAYVGIKINGNPSAHNWYYPLWATDNDYFFFAGFHSGTLADPKVWDEYGKVGSIYYGDQYGYLRLKVEGNPLTGLWYFPQNGGSDDKWEFMGKERVGSFNKPKNWDDAGTAGDIYHIFTNNRDYYYKLKQTGSPSAHGWRFPSNDQSNNYWTFVGYSPGTKERPKNWNEYGDKGCFYSDTTGFFKLKTNGNPEEHTWYYPGDNTSNDIWEVHGFNLGTKRFPKDYTDDGSTGDIYISEWKTRLYRLKDTGSPSHSYWVFPDRSTGPNGYVNPDTDSDSACHWDSELPAYNKEIPSKWMSYFHDDTPLNQISIPGTHDSSTFAATGTAVARGAVMTQNANDTIYKQLSDGIRFIDARCRHISNAFAMHHGSYYLNHMFGDVLNACYSFLSENPSECIIVSVKPEYDESNCTRSFSATFEQSYYNKDWWYVGDHIPKLGDVRGKIVLLSRFAGSYMGILTPGWKDDDITQINSYIYIQDKYNEHNEVNKWHAIRDAWNFSSGNNKTGWLTLNFTSIADKGLTTPYDYAVDKNPELASYISNRKEGGGITISDYYYEGKIAQNVIKTNFRDV